MSMPQASELQDVLVRVKAWPEELQISLASEILSSVHERPARRKPLADLVGVLAGDQPPPDDEQVRAILDEERRRKFG